MREAEGPGSLLSCFCPAEVVTSLSQCYSALLDSMNAEIRIRWLQIVVRNDYYPDLHRVRRFLESQVGLVLVQMPPPPLQMVLLSVLLCTGASGASSPYSHPTALIPHQD